jgi:hypothetical protein
LVFEFNAWYVNKLVLFDLKKINNGRNGIVWKNKTEIMWDVLKRH